ncbi:MAG TPA: FCD domain-containing protein [Roseiflexaceae bacterium]|nr:FCD domain-containing protein [Roseiflexaceae bacterium]
MARSNAQQVHLAVVAAIQRRLAQGEWQPGDRLPSIAQLAQELGVSTGSVREAARVLASRGILRIEHGRGMFVAATHEPPVNLYEYFQQVETGSLLELFEARRLLEPELAALAAERATEEEAQRIYDLAVMMEQSAKAGEDFAGPDIQFHLAIAAAARNAVLAGVMVGLNDLIVAGRRLTVALPGMTPRAVRYHLLVAEAIRERNPLQARLLMLAHMNDAIDSLLAARPLAADHQSGVPATSAIVIEQRSLSTLR